MTHAEKIAIFDAADAVFNAALDAADGLNCEARREARDAASEALRAVYVAVEAPAPALCTLRPTVDSVAPGCAPCMFADDGLHLILIVPRDGIRTLTYDLYVTRHATGKTTLYPTFYSIRTALRTANRLHGTDCREAIAPLAKRYGVRRVITGADGAVQHDQTTGDYTTFALACAAVHADYPPREGRADLRFTDIVSYRIGNCAVQVTATARD